MNTALGVVQTFIAAIEAKDIDAAVALLSQTCEYDNVPMGKVVGPDAVRATLGPFVAQCTTVEWVVFRESATNSTVFNERLDRFHMPHGWVEIPVIGVWEVVDGLITLWRDYFDLATFRSQLTPAGSPPPEGVGTPGEHRSAAAKRSPNVTVAPIAGVTS